MKIPSGYLLPSIRNGRAMPSTAITTETVAGWKKDDDQVLLLRLSRGQELPRSVLNYLDSSAGRSARLGYKCRNRTPWYAVPDVQIPDFVMSYMAGRAVNLVRNNAGVTCTNSVHSVRLHDQALASKLIPSWSSPFVRLSCEIEGHALGGGMLKLEPREASRILFPSPAIMDQTVNEALQDAITHVQRWRHYVD